MIGKLVEEIEEKINVYNKVKVVGVESHIHFQPAYDGVLQSGTYIISEFKVAIKAE